MQIFLGVHFRSRFRIQRLLARQWIHVWRQYTSFCSHLARGHYFWARLLFLGLKSTWFGISWEILPKNVLVASVYEV